MTQELALDTLVIRHQDNDLSYRLKKGGYFLGEGFITISVDCQATGEGDPFPPCAMLCLENHRIPHPPKVGDVYSCRGGMLVNSDEVDQRAWGYFTFHVDQITQRWSVIEVDSEGLVIALEANHDDVNYYGEQARETTSLGRFKLTPKPLDGLWVPS
jgi:hypothetical protein